MLMRKANDIIRVMIFLHGVCASTLDLLFSVPFAILMYVVCLLYKRHHVTCITLLLSSL